MSVAQQDRPSAQPYIRQVKKQRPTQNSRSKAHSERRKVRLYGDGIAVSTNMLKSSPKKVYDCSRAVIGETLRGLNVVANIPLVSSSGDNRLT